MSRKIAISSALILFLCTGAFAEDKRFSIPKSRPHSAREIICDIGCLYVAHWAGYLILFKVISDAGGTCEKYKENFFLKNIQWWDGDSFWWNFVAHPCLGSQTYLYYRARGYSKQESFWGSFTASFLFESTIEVLQEGFSFNDAVITPTLGYVLGDWIEKKSIEMINSDDKLHRILARTINPWLNFEFYEGATFTPVISSRNIGFIFSCEF